MSQWSTDFETVMDTLDTDGTKNELILGLLHAFIKSWEHENNCLIWITNVPGGNIFGSTVVFVNDKVINKLQWSFAEWEDGTAPLGVFDAEEAKLIKLHLNVKSSLPIPVHVRKKTTLPAQTGDDYVMYFHHDLPYSLRLTVAVPKT